MYTRILVPVDGSDFSERILPHVVWLGSKTGAAVALLRLVETPDALADAKRALDILAARHAATPVCTVGSDDVARLILDEAAKVPGTLVAITSHGRSGVMRALMGSTALNVLRAGREPLLVYRPPTDEAEPVPTQIDRIVVPLDGSELSESIEPLAAGFARWIGARIVVASVVDPSAREAVPDAASSDVVESGYVHARAAHLAERYGVDVGWEVLHGDPESAIPNFVRSLPNTMLAMTTRGRSAVQSALLGSVTAASLRDGGAPVLTRMG